MKPLEDIAHYSSAEFLLSTHPNGGSVILGRSTWTATILFLLAVATHEALLPGGSVSIDAARTALAQHLPWFGAIFAGAYVGFYSRFASQWGYLAGLYNEQMSAGLGSEEFDPAKQNDYNGWCAGFIEDAETLHLATKPLFASVIEHLLTRPKVREKYAQHTPGGEARLAHLEREVRAALERERSRRVKRIRS